MQLFYTDLLMSRACPELHWRWLELHDSVSMGSGERRVRTATGTRQWRIHRRPKPRYSVLDERRLHYAAWEGCLEHVKAMLEHGVPANCQLVTFNFKLKTIFYTFVHVTSFCRLSLMEKCVNTIALWSYQNTFAHIFDLKGSIILL